LPADRPIIGALRLPERLRVVETPYYRVHGFEDFMARQSQRSQPEGGEPLRGVSCRHADDACAAIDAGANFVVLNEPVEPTELANLCETVPAPVYARGMPLGRAWSLGASGVNALG
jgi:hypothetical protein